MDPETRAELDELIADGLAALRDEPAVWQAERLAGLLGVPPASGAAGAGELDELARVIEAHASPEAAAVLDAMARLFAAPLGPAAAGAVERLAAAGVAPPPPGPAPQLLNGLVLEGPGVELLAVLVGIGDEVAFASLVFDAGPIPFVNGGVNAPMAAERAADLVDDLRTGVVAGELQEREPAGVVAALAERLQDAADHDVPMLAGAALERPLLAWLLTGGPDRWPVLDVIDADPDELAGAGRGDPRPTERPRRSTRRTKAKAARTARKRNRRR